MGGILLGIGLLLLLCGLLVAAGAQRNRVAAGLPLSRNVGVVYDDSRSDWQEVAQPLYAAAYDLSGKPDYVLFDRRARLWIPVEVKPTRYADAPYDSDRLQLAAYCVLLEEDDAWAVTPPYGLLRYANHTFRIDYTDALHDELIATLREMRELRLSLPATYYDDEIAPILSQPPPHRTITPLLARDVYPIPQHPMTARCRACRYRATCWGGDT